MYHPRGARLVRATLSSLMRKKALVLSLGVMVAQQTLALLVIVRPNEGQRNISAERRKKYGRKIERIC